MGAYERATARRMPTQLRMESDALSQSLSEQEAQRALSGCAHYAALLTQLQSQQCHSSLREQELSQLRAALTEHEASLAQARSELASVMQSARAEKQTLTKRLSMSDDMVVAPQEATDRERHLKLIAEEKEQLRAGFEFELQTLRQQFEGDLAGAQLQVLAERQQHLAKQSEAAAAWAERERELCAQLDSVGARLAMVQQQRDSVQTQLSALQRQYVTETQQLQTQLRQLQQQSEHMAAEQRTVADASAESTERLASSYEQLLAEHNNLQKDFSWQADQIVSLRRALEAARSSSAPQVNSPDSGVVRQESSKLQKLEGEREKLLRRQQSLTASLHEHGREPHAEGWCAAEGINEQLRAAVYCLLFCLQLVTRVLSFLFCFVSYRCWDLPLSRYYPCIQN